MVGFWPPTQCVSIDHSLFPILPNPFFLLSWKMLAGLLAQETEICRCTLTSTWFQIHFPRISLKCKKRFFAAACWKLARMVQSDCNGQWSLWWLALDSCLLSTPSLPPHPSHSITPFLCLLPQNSYSLHYKSDILHCFHENPAQSPELPFPLLFVGYGGQKEAKRSLCRLAHCCCPWHQPTFLIHIKLDPEKNL